MFKTHADYTQAANLFYTMHNLINIINVASSQLFNNWLHHVWCGKCIVKYEKFTIKADKENQPGGWQLKPSSISVDS